MLISSSAWTLIGLLVSTAIAGEAGVEGETEPTPAPDAGKGALVVQAEEQEATRQDLNYWLENMVLHHRYSIEEAAAVCGLALDTVQEKLRELHLDQRPAPEEQSPSVVRVLPYPGGRHPRLGFLEGAVNPQRGTKVTLFLPWPDAGYVVLDLPEAIHSDKGLLFLAHHDEGFPTMWEKAGMEIPNVDWSREASGRLSREQKLPNGARFGATVTPGEKQVDLQFWLENNTEDTLRNIRGQICLMLTGAPDFNYLSNARKIFQAPVAAAPSRQGNRWILVAFERAAFIWGNKDVPCIHSDPLLTDVHPGERVAVRGRIWFCQADDVADEIARAERAFPPLKSGAE